MWLRRHTKRLYFSKHQAAVRLQATTGGLYGILGVPKTASQEEIRAAYKRLAHSLHPDKHLQDQVDTTAAFIKCKLAYEILIDRQSRQQYDEQYLDAATQQDLHSQADTPWSGHSRTSRQYQSSSGAADNGLHSSAAAAAAAAGTGSSGLSSHASTAGPDQHSASASHALMPAVLHGHQQGHGTVTEDMRGLLLQHHGLVLEQFHSMQEALDFLQELQQQQVLLGLAAEDYLDECSGQDRGIGTSEGLAGDNRQQQRWGNFHPGEFTPPLSDM